MIISIKEIRNFLICVLIPLILGYASNLISTLFSGMSTSEYYSQLIKPGFAPHVSIFPIVWTILYVLMGISSYLILKKGYDLSKVRDGMFYYWLQIGLSFTWNTLFFGLDLKLTALVSIVMLIVVAIIMIIKFSKVDKRAAYVNIPYLIWLSYAIFLNYFIWIINR
ncbi:MAG: TspO/MBR family protein [Romboutsia sp.]